MAKTVFDNGGYVGYKGTFGQVVPLWVTTGLVMHVDAGNASSYPGAGTTWTDLTGTVTAGTLSDTTYSSASGGTMIFNGSSSRATFPNSTALDNNAVTMEVWVKPNNLTQQAFWFEKGTVNTQYAFWLNGATVVWRNPTHGDLNVSDSGLSTTVWQQMVATYVTGTGRRIYRNATQVASDAATGTLPVNAGGMSIGAYGGTGSAGYYYNGSLAICRIYNRALSQEEVQQNYNAHKARFGL